LARAKYCPRLIFIRFFFSSLFFFLGSIGSFRCLVFIFRGDYGSESLFAVGFLFFGSSVLFSVVISSVGFGGLFRVFVSSEPLRFLETSTPYVFGEVCFGLVFCGKAYF
jgi:hypothetical protein